MVALVLGGLVVGPAIGLSAGILWLSDGITGGEWLGLAFANPATRAWFVAALVFIPSGILIFLIMRRSGAARAQASWAVVVSLLPAAGITGIVVATTYAVARAFDG